MSAIEMVTADGDLVELTRQDEDFDGAVVALGALGIVTTVTLDILPTYDVRQYLYFALPFEVIDEHFDDLFSSAYSVSLVTLTSRAVIKRRITVAGLIHEYRRRA